MWQLMGICKSVLLAVDVSIVAGKVVVCVALVVPNGFGCAMRFAVTSDSESECAS